MKELEREDALRARFEAAGQGHVFQGTAALSAADRARFARELAGLDLDLVARLSRLLARERGPRATRFEPAAVFPLARDAAQRAHAALAEETGARILSAGGVGYLLVAGGQASRLGWEAPKGVYPVGPVSGRSLFEIFARKLLAAVERHGAPVRWYVMTSPANDADTRAFFARANWFGLASSDVVFFSQSTLPALDRDGRILLSAPGQLFLAPNGHGGVLAALSDSGALAHARAHGVERFSYFQVDNPLARPADPLFLGLHALAGAEMSSKVVHKRDAAEKVGVLGRVDGALTCIEYSDLPDDLREERDPEGRLAFGAGSIAMHMIERTFVEELTRGGLRLPWHVAQKRMRALDARGVLCDLEGFKFEAFVFDALQRTSRSAILEVDRATEFSPVKNASGEDSPETARRDQCRLFASWVRDAGLGLPPPDPAGVHAVEVDPLFAEDAQSFARRARSAMGARPVTSERGHFYA